MNPQSRTYPEPRYGYLHTFYGPDMDGSLRAFEWVASDPMPGDPRPEAGWFCRCVVEPEAGWLGPFATAEDAVHAATTEEGFITAYYGDDPMGDHHGRNV